MCVKEIKSQELFCIMSGSIYRKYVMPCPRFIKANDSIMCMGEEYARSVLEGADHEHCDHFTIRKTRMWNSCFLYMTPRGWI